MPSCSRSRRSPRSPSARSKKKTGRKKFWSWLTNRNRPVFPLSIYLFLAFLANSIPVIFACIKLFGSISWADVPIMESLPAVVTSIIPFLSHCLWGHFRGPTCRNHLQPVGSSYCLSLFGPWAIPPCIILFMFHWCLKKRKAIWPLSLSTFRKELILPKFRQNIIRLRSKPFNRSHTTRIW